LQKIEKFPAGKASAQKKNAHFRLQPVDFVQLGVFSMCWRAVQQRWLSLFVPQCTKRRNQQRLIFGLIFDQKGLCTVGG
jgi:hypothetical protein